MNASYNVFVGRAVDELWSVASGTPHVDAAALARAVEGAVTDEPSDYRTRLLVRDSLRALEYHWGRERFEQWLKNSRRRASIELAGDRASLNDTDEERGFPTLRRRVMDVVQPEAIDRFLRELSTHVRKPTRMVMGRSIALIMAGRLSRSTDDVDVVDEVPAELREQHGVLEDLTQVHKLRLAHFQSHYLPDGWERRVRSVGAYGDLHVSAVDPIDVFVGKLFSVRMKDREDLNALVSQLDREAVRRRVKEATGRLQSDARLLDAARQNWFVLFGDELPVSGPASA